MEQRLKLVRMSMAIRCTGFVMLPVLCVDMSSRTIVPPFMHSNMMSITALRVKEGHELGGYVKKVVKTVLVIVRG